MGLQLFLTRTFFGRAVLAVAQDQLALRLMGVNPIRSGYNAVMPTFKGQLKDEQIDGLITYIKCLK